MNFKLAQYREKSPYTQADIARIAGVSAKTEWNWEQSKSFPNAAQLWDIAEALHCTPNDLLGWYDTHPREDAPPLAADEADVINGYRSCTPEWKRHVRMNVEAAAGASLKSAESPAPIEMDAREAV